MWFWYSFHASFLLDGLYIVSFSGVISMTPKKPPPDPSGDGCYNAVRSDLGLRCGERMVRRCRETGYLGCRHVQLAEFKHQMFVTSFSLKSSWNYQMNTFSECWYYIRVSYLKSIVRTSKLHAGKLGRFVGQRGHDNFILIKSAQITFFYIYGKRIWPWFKIIEAQDAWNTKHDRDTLPFLFGQEVWVLFWWSHVANVFLRWRGAFKCLQCYGA